MSIVTSTSLLLVLLLQLLLLVPLSSTTITKNDMSKATDKSVEASLLLANKLQREGSYKEAYQQYKITITVDPSLASAWTNLGHLLLNHFTNADYEHLLSSLSNSSGSNSSSNGGSNSNPTVSNQLQQEIIFCFNTSFLLQPTNPKSSYNLAVALHQFDQLEEARNYYENAILEFFALIEDNSDNNGGANSDNSGNSDNSNSDRSDRSDRSDSTIDLKISNSNSNSNSNNGDTIDGITNKYMSTIINSYYNLGLIHQELENLESAIFCYKKVLEYDNHHIESRLNYCNILFSLLSPQVEQCYKDVLTIAPTYVRGIVNLASYYMSKIPTVTAIGTDNSNNKKNVIYVEKATDLFRKALDLDANNTMAKFGLLSLHNSQQDDQKGVDETQFSAEYIRELFDSYSFNFEKSLSELHYKSHLLIGELLANYSCKIVCDLVVNEYSKSESHQLNDAESVNELCSRLLQDSNARKGINVVDINMLDLGAGTGLTCDPARRALTSCWSTQKDRLPMNIEDHDVLRTASNSVALDGRLDDGQLRALMSTNELVQIHFTAVDLSSKMLRKAKARNCYDHIVVDDLISFLSSTVDQHDPQTNKSLFSIILAADVFMYFGDLLEVINKCRKTISANGLLIFTVERLDTSTYSTHIEGFHLQSSGRFAHSKDYLINVSAAVDFEVLLIEEAVPRYDKGVPVLGYLVVLSPINHYKD